MKNSFLFKRDKYWHLEYYDELQGRVRRVTTKCKLKSDAIHFLINNKDKIINSTKVQNVFLKSFISEYKNYIKANLSKRYLSEICSTFNSLEKYFGDTLLREITQYKLEQFLSAVYQKSKHSAKHHYSILKSAFNKAISWNYLSQNPLQKIKPPKIPKSFPAFINENELKYLLEKEVDPTLNNIYTLAYYTGMRLGEIVYLKWRHISFDEKLIRVANTEEFTTKTQRERLIPMCDKVFELLQVEFAKKSMSLLQDYVFTKNARRFEQDFISRAFKKAVNAVALENHIDGSIHFHNLRHSFASTLVQKGVSLFVVKELLGHADIKSTQIYAHLRTDDLRNAVERLD